MALKNSKKGLFMTLLILILFFLILGELFSFALLTMSYNNIDQSAALGSASLNYGKLLQTSAGQFAGASLQRALYTLANYELNATMRKSNFIVNTSQYLTYLMVNGTLPNVVANSIPANYLAKSMGNLTLKSYNSSSALLFGTSSVGLKLNQTRPLISQQSPYTLSVSYVENAALNSTSGRFVYPIAVNSTISLNGTPDLFYYQQGMPRNIRFASLANATSLIGGINATNGNYLGSAYGPVYIVPTGTSGLTCASLSTMITANVPAFSFAPYNQMLILATTNAIGITNGGSGPNCAAQYGGLITYSINSLSSPPAIPWLLYPSASGEITNLINGQQVLMLGNTLSTYNIQNLINAASNGYYFASPFVPSYLDRSQSSVLRQNPNGIFAFSTSNLQVASIHGTNTYVKAAPSNSLTGTFTATLWFKPLGATSNGGQYILFDRLPSDFSFDVFVNPTNTVTSDIGNGAGWIITNAGGSATINPNGWNQVGVVVTPTTWTYYINGAQTANGIFASSTPIAYDSTHNVYMGSFPTGAHNWDFSMADVQFYSNALSSQQISQLYQEGLQSPPVPNNGLSSWWALNGNVNDSSGSSVNGIASNIIFSFAQNYSRDSILSITVPTSLSPIPGLFNCNNNAQCSNSILPHAYLGYNPLEMQQASFQAATFNGYGLVQIPSSTTLSPSSGVTISGWVYWPVSAVKEMILKNNNANTGVGSYELFQNGQQLSFRIVKGGSFTTVTSTNTLSLNAWHYVVGAWDGTTLRMYIDGVQDGTTTTLGGPIDTTTGYLTFGAYDNLQFPYIGSLYNVQIYGSALGANQISQLYRQGLNGLPVPSNTLLGWWPLNGNANDYSGYAQNGAPSNVIFNPFQGAYNGPGLSSITAAANEWQSIGIPRSGG